MADLTEQMIARTFPDLDEATVRAVLDQYGAEAHEREQDRVRLAALSLSGGDLDELSALIQRAKRDYRDVLYWQQLAGGYADPLIDRLDAAVLTPALTPERLALLCEAVPGLARVAASWNPSKRLHPPPLT